MRWAAVANACWRPITALATPDLRIGLPETKLGIMPGFGGSVRLPRLLGADSALEIIAAGKDVGADQALKIGLGGWRGRCGKTTRRRAGDPTSGHEWRPWTGKRNVSRSWSR